MKEWLTIRTWIVRVLHSTYSPASPNFLVEKVVAECESRKVMTAAARSLDVIDTPTHTGGSNCRDSTAFPDATAIPV